MSSTVTACSPLVISDQHSRQAVAAVVALKMKYSTFYEHVVNATMYCDNCTFTCRSPVGYTLIDCRVLYVIGHTSKPPRAVRKSRNMRSVKMWNSIFELIKQSSHFCFLHADLERYAPLNNSCFDLSIHVRHADDIIEN